VHLSVLHHPPPLETHPLLTIAHPAGGWFNFLKLGQ